MPNAAAGGILLLAPYNHGMRILLAVIVLAVLGTAGAWIAAGRAEGPKINIAEPTVVGQTGRLDLTVEAPAAKLTRLDVTLEQNGKSTALFTLGTGAAALGRDGANRLHLTQPLGKKQVASLEQGSATISVSAARPVLFGYRQASATARKEFRVDLTPPRVSVVSRLHYVNQGGSEMVVYRATPAEAESGVRVGQYEYPGYPAKGAGIATSDPALRVAFFALMWNQDPNTPISLYARDAHGNETSTVFDYRVFPKEYKHSTLHIGDAFLQRVVPAVLANSPDFKVDDPSDLAGSYVRINHDMRRANAETIAGFAKQTAPEMLWHGPFLQLENSAVEAYFADQRTYLYDGKPIDNEVHLGYDLASVAGASIRAANRGRIVHAGWLGIYGNCIVIDHGMGVQSLYGHLSSIEVKVGQMVDKGQEIGRSGATGLAGGDHLHFSVLVNGHFVTPIEWWSDKWVADRITRKLQEAGAPADAGTPVNGN